METFINLGITDKVIVGLSIVVLGLLIYKWGSHISKVFVAKSSWPKTKATVVDVNNNTFTLRYFNQELNRSADIKYTNSKCMKKQDDVIDIAYSKTNIREIYVFEDFKEEFYNLVKFLIIAIFLVLVIYLKLT